MTNLYAPYEAPKIRSRGWRVGPIQHRTVAAVGDCAGLPAELSTITVTFIMDIGGPPPTFPLTFPYSFDAPAFAQGAGLPAEVSNVLVEHFTSVPAVGDCAGLAAVATPALSVTANLGDGSGGTALVPTLSIAYPNADNFDRTDSSTSMGSNWTNRTSVMGIISNTAYPVSGTSIASWNTAMPADDVPLSVTLSALVGSIDIIYMVLGADSAGTNIAYAAYSGSSVSISTATSWSLSGNTTRASGSISMTAGDVMTFNRTGSTYSILKNGASTGISWIDGGAAQPRDSSHRLVGIGGFNTSGNYRSLDNFTTT